jgi:glycosyltransferase involved in cell wall biosynthesis
MPGFVANPYAYMRAASVFALSSAWEGLPGVLIEALACGTPVVSTDCPSGPEEILEGGRYGRLTPVGDATALAQAIMATLEQPPDPDVLRRRAADFSIQRALPEFLAVFKIDGQPDTSLP